MDGFEHAYKAYADMGRWIGRVWALLIAWVVTYVLVFLLILFPGHEWMLYLTPVPVLVHMIAEPLLIKHEAKTFGTRKE